ncbi:MAG: hypothetical protein R3E96_02985 [Planctomycetota bacterium]
MKSLLPLLPAALLMSTARADFLVGILHDPVGNPVLGANLDVFDHVTGIEIDLTGDGTAVDGSFAVQVPAGLYDVIINAPVPPSSQLVSRRIDSVQVTTLADMGVVTLSQGVHLSGTFFKPGGVPAAFQDLEITNEDTGQAVVMTTPGTDALGSFLTSVPTGHLSLRIRPDRLAPLAAAKEYDLFIGSNYSMGAVTLPVGHQVTLTVQTPAGAPVFNADLDAINLATGEKALTPGDNTNALGIADFIVPAGTYNFEICPPLATRLVAKVVPSVTTSPLTALGVQPLQAGFLVQGTVLQPGGAPAANIDLDVFQANGATAVPTCADDTDAAGHYAVILPAGNFDMVFANTVDRCSALQVEDSVVIGGDTVHNVQLQSQNIGCRYCEAATANSTGRAAHLVAIGSRIASQGNLTLRAQDLPPNQFGIFLAGQGSGFTANAGASQGHLCLAGAIGRYNQPGQVFSSGAAGVITLPLNLSAMPTPTVPAPVLAGQTWYFQAWYRDFNPSNTSNFTDALEIPFQ